MIDLALENDSSLARPDNSNDKDEFLSFGYKVTELFAPHGELY
jgi:hypothetical protein